MSPVEVHVTNGGCILAAVVANLHRVVEEPVSVILQVLEWNFRSVLPVQSRDGNVLNRVSIQIAGRDAAHPRARRVARAQSEVAGAVVEVDIYLVFGARIAGPRAAVVDDQREVRRGVMIEAPHREVARARG